MTFVSPQPTLHPRRGAQHRRRVEPDDLHADRQPPSGIMGVPLKQITDRAQFAARWREHALPADGAGVWATTVAVLRAAGPPPHDRHAAEMAFFAVLTLVPSTIAVGSALGLWAYLAGIAILLGGELNAVLRARRAG